MVILLVGLVAFVRILDYHWRQGALLIGGALLLAAVFRLALADHKIGLIAIRGKRTDVILYSSLGLLILLIALTIVGGPFDPISS